MKTIKEPTLKTYQRDRALTETVLDIIINVKDRGDAALIDYAKKFDGLDMTAVRVQPEQVKKAYAQVSEETVQALQFAAEQIRFFAEQQLKCLRPLDIPGRVPGLRLGHKLVPVDRCGCYIPSGRYPLPSSALMSALTAKVAGVGQVAACSPPFRGYGGIHPAVLVAMDIAGADEIYCVGGAQAIAAMAYGTEEIAKADLIVGPGNKYVTEAKRQVMGDVGIDSLAGPSEVLIIADDTANPTFVAIDLLAQCEHDPDALPILVCTSQRVIDEALKELDRLMETLPTKETAKVSWANNGAVYLADSLDEACDYSNKIAPEHLEVQVANEQDVAAKLYHFGSLFVGHYAPVSFGDFTSGTNHILPTMSTARFTSGVWVGTFIKTAFFQFVSEEACREMAAPCMHIAQTEGLHAHSEAVRLRLE